MLALFGGLALALVLGLVGAVIGWGVGTDSSGGSPALYWLIATGIPAGTLLLLFLISWKAPNFRKGVLIGLCIWTLVAGLCNVGMTSGFKEIPRLSH